MSKNHNSDQPDLPFRLSGSQAKVAFALRHNAEGMLERAGFARGGFLTLTVGDDSAEGFQQIWDAAEASRRINNLNRRVLPEIFEQWVTVTERHKSGAIHFHILGVCRSDIRKGFCFDAMRAGRNTGACRELRELWGVLQARLPEYGFGRAQLTPIEKTGAQVASYVSKYVEKNLFNRLEGDRGKKLVRYSGFDGHLRPNDFGWCSDRATAWRTKAEALAGLVGVKAGEAGRDEVSSAFGPRWAFRLTAVMRSVDDRPLPAFEWTWAERECARALVARYASQSWLLRRAEFNEIPPARQRVAVSPFVS